MRKRGALSAANTGILDIRQITPGELVAPVGIWFEATQLSGFAVSEAQSGGVYDPTAHEITYIWDFDDPGNFTTSLNLPSAWNNKGLDYGKKAYHVFARPGTYVVRLWAIDREGTTGERTISVNVSDPADVYSGHRTICISRNANFTGAPMGAQMVTNFTDAQAAYRNLGESGRLLLRAGEIFQDLYEIDSPQVNHHVGAFGAGEKPVLRPPQITAGNATSCFSFNNRNNVVDAVFWGLRFEGEWDATRETGDPRGTGISYGTHNTVKNWTSLIYQCDFTGLASLIPGLSVMPFTSAVVDCNITNWQDYGVGLFGQAFLDETRLALVGNAIHQAQDSCEGGYGKVGLSNDHGPFRYSDTQEVLISACDFYTANSWAGGVQPCLRLAQGGLRAENRGNYFLSMNRIACEGGGVILGIDGANEEAPESPGNHIIDMFLLVDDYSTIHWLGPAYGGTTIRNGLMVRSERADTLIDAPALAAFVSFEVQNSQNGNRESSMDVYSCTLLNLRADDIPLTRSTEAFSRLRLDNIIHHAPYLAKPDIPFAPIDISGVISGFTPRSRGRRVGPEKVGTTLSVSIPPRGTLTMPYPSGTSQSDYRPTGRHTVKLGSNSYYFSYRGTAAFTFNPTDITVQNLSPDTWHSESTLLLGLDQETLTTDTRFASPKSVPRPVPQSGSQALTDEGGLQAYTQFDTGQRTRPKGAV